MLIDGIEVEVIYKNIKNVHLAVYPPDGSRVRLAVPNDTSISFIEQYVKSKTSWIRNQQQIFAKVERQSKREYVGGESHYFLGKRYMLRVYEIDNQKTKVECINNQYLDMYVKIGSITEQKGKILKAWYRVHLKSLLLEYISKWENILQVKINQFRIKEMLTKWGTCQPQKKNLLFNLELAKKSINSINYIVLHELLHLIEPKHNDHFKELLFKYLPSWEAYKNELNQQIM